MPTLTLTVTYDGSDPEITRALSRVVSALGSGSAAAAPPHPRALPQASTVLDKIARRFAGFVSNTPRLAKVMEAWLRSEGKLPLTELGKGSGVRKQEDYAGIGSGLTRTNKT